MDLVEGRHVAGNGRLLDSAAYRSFGATWQLLPQTGAPLIDAQGMPMPFDMYDAQEWKRLKFIPDDEDVARHLQLTQRLRSLLAQPIDIAPARRLPLLVALGSGKPTLERVLYQISGVRGRLFDCVKHARRRTSAIIDGDRLFGDGDGVVTASAAGLPPVWDTVMDVQTLKLRRSHRRLMHDSSLQDEIARLFGLSQGR